jgi:hypothetical protein
MTQNRGCQERGHGPGEEAAMIQTQFTLYLENKPGALAQAIKVLADHNVNIEGISAASTSDVGLVQIIVSDPKAAAAALNKGKIPYTTQQVGVLLLPNRPGVLAQVTAAMAKHQVNINYIYGTSCRSGCDCAVVVSAPALEMVERIWERMTK